MGSYLKMTPSQGGVIHASHIERPLRAFAVEYEAFPRQIDGLGVIWENGVRRMTALAETAEGALAILRYHHFTGKSHRVIGPRDKPWRDEGTNQIRTPPGWSGSWEETIRAAGPYPDPYSSTSAEENATPTR